MSTNKIKHIGVFTSGGDSPGMNAALYAIASTTFDSRVALLTITVVILAGTYLTSRVDLEEGIRVAQEEDARNEAQGMES